MKMSTEKSKRPALSPTGLMLHILLKVLAMIYNHRSGIKKYLITSDGPLDFVIGIRTENGSVFSAIISKDGALSVVRNIPDNAHAVMVFRTAAAVRKVLSGTSTDQIYMILKNEARIDGSITYINLFAFLLSLLINKKQIKLMEKERNDTQKSLLKKSPDARNDLSNELAARRKLRLKCNKVDNGVKYLEDAYLSDHSLDDFPRLRKFLDIHLTAKPEVCPEIPRLVTEWHRKNGFETDKNGHPCIPVMRKALAYKYLMENRKPIISENSLIAGTTTSKKVGCPLYPEGSAVIIWNELITMPYRTYNPFDISEETRELLHNDIFPYWMKRNFREWVRDKYNNPLCQQIDERFALYFNWKVATISHTIPDFPKILRLGTSGIIAEIKTELEKEANLEKRVTLESMMFCLEGLTAYSKNLSKQAMKDAKTEKDPIRQGELETIAVICEHVVESPPVLLTRQLMPFGLHGWDSIWRA